jgi:hypothetical protein
MRSQSQNKNASRSKAAINPHPHDQEKTASLRRPSDQIQTSTLDRARAETFGAEQHDLLAPHVLLGRDAIPDQITKQS